MNDCFYSDSTDNDDIAYTPVVNLFPRETFSSSLTRLLAPIRLFVSAFSRISAKLRGIPTVIYALAKPRAISVNSFAKDLIMSTARKGKARIPSFLRGADCVARYRAVTLENK
jgi:hypothetical protein